MPTFLRTASLCAAGVLSLSSIAVADDFQFQVDGAFETFDPDGPAGDVDTIGVRGTYFFSPVNTDGVPLAEAPFLRRSSFVNAGIARAEFGNADFDILDVNVGYYIPNTIFYGRLGVTHSDDFPGDETNVNATFGVAPIDGLLVTTDFDEDGWDPNVTARLVSKLPNDHYYAGSVSFVDPDGGDTSIGVAFDYYFDLSTSLGIGYEEAGDTWKIRGEKFFTPEWAAGFSVSTADGGDGFGVHVTWRH